MGSSENSSETSALFGGPFQCELCQKAFSGPAPYMQHLKSAKHLKKENMGLMSSRIDGNQLQSSPEGTAPSSRTSTNSLEAKTAGYPTHCEICDVPFTGFENSVQHFAGKKHKKSLERQQILRQLYQYSSSSVSEANEAGVNLSSASSTPASSFVSSTTGLASAPSTTGSTTAGLASKSSASTITSVVPMVEQSYAPSASSLATGSSNRRRLAGSELFTGLHDADLLTEPQTTAVSDSAVSSSSSAILVKRASPSAEPTPSNLATSTFKEINVECKPRALPMQADNVGMATAIVHDACDTKAPSITFTDDGSGVQKVFVREAEGYGCEVCGILLFVNLTSALEHYETDTHKFKRGILASPPRDGDVILGGH